MKKLQRKELAILNNAADVVTSLDRRLRFLAIGESAQRILGYKSDDLIGRSLVSILDGATTSDAAGEFETIAKSALSSVMGGLVLLTAGLNEEVAPSFKEEAESAVRSSEKLIGFIDDLLDFQKLRAGQMPLEILEQRFLAGSTSRFACHR